MGGREYRMGLGRENTSGPDSSCHCGLQSQKAGFTCCLSWRMQKVRNGIQYLRILSNRLCPQFLNERLITMSRPQRECPKVKMSQAWVGCALETLKLKVAVQNAFWMLQALGSCSLRAQPLALASSSNLCPGLATQKEHAAANGVKFEGQQEVCLSLESVTTSMSPSTAPGLIHVDGCISKDGWIQHIFRTNRYYIIGTRQNTEALKHRYSQMVLIFRRPLTDRKVGKLTSIKV